MPNLTPTQFASLHAHAIAAELVRLGVSPPDVGAEAGAVAILEDAGVRVFVSITRYEGPARIHPSTLALIEAMRAGAQSAQSAPAPAPVQPPAPQPNLTPLQRAIVSVLRPDVPRKATWVAAKIGRRCGGSFRSALADLVRFGVLRLAGEGGYLLAGGTGR